MEIEQTHKENKNLISKYNINIGDKLILKQNLFYFKENDVFTISHIHSLYGWVLFKETEQLPQEVKGILKITIRRFKK